MTDFWDKLDKTGDCWLWKQSLEKNGYARVMVNYRRHLIHRYAWSLINGPIPKGAEVDHRCRVRHCANPAHLRLATRKENGENQGLHTTNTSGYRGVSYQAARGKWLAMVKHNGKPIYVGRYDTPEEANEQAIAKRLELYTHNDGDRIGV